MKVTKTARYEIAYEKALYDLLSDIQYSVWRIKNRAVSQAWDWQQFSFGYKERFGEYPKAKEVLGKTLAPDIYGSVKEYGSEIYSSTVDASVQEAVKKFDTEKADVLAGRQALSQYRRNGSFPIKSSQIRDIARVKTNEYTANIALLSREGAKERGGSTRFPVTLRTGPGARDILDRIIDGEYKLCDSRISKVKTKFYLLIAFSFEQEALEVDADRVMGVDMGIVYPAYMAFNFDAKLRYNIEGGEITAFRDRVEARRRSMQRQAKYAGQGRRGRGRKTLLKPIEKLQHKVENFRKTTNHKYAKYIVDMAIKHGCGTIQVEDLTGINERALFLKRWSYYELQSFIEYRAKSVGIKFVKVSPRYTSQRCAECGHISQDNRKSQDKFACQACGYETNADFNAARNIATPGIAKLIEKQTEKLA